MAASGKLCSGLVCFLSQKKTQRKKYLTMLVACPICSVKVHDSFINEHIDSNCKLLKSPLKFSKTTFENDGSSKVKSQSKLDRFFTAPSNRCNIKIKRKSPLNDLTNVRHNKKDNKNANDNISEPPLKKRRLSVSKENETNSNNTNTETKIKNMEIVENDEKKRLRLQFDCKLQCPQISQFNFSANFDTWNQKNDNNNNNNNDCNTNGRNMLCFYFDCNLVGQKFCQRKKYCVSNIIKYTNESNRNGNNSTKTDEYDYFGIIREKWNAVDNNACVVVKYNYYLENDSTEAKSKKKIKEDKSNKFDIKYEALGYIPSVISRYLACIIDHTNVVVNIYSLKNEQTAVRIHIMYQKKQYNISKNENVSMHWTMIELIETNICKL